MTPTPTAATSQRPAGHPNTVSVALPVPRAAAGPARPPAPAGHRGGQRTDGEGEVEDALHRVADPVGPLAALDGIADERVEQSPGSQGEQGGGEEHEQEPAEGPLGDPLDGALLVGGLVATTARRQLDGEEADGRVQDPLADEADPAERVLAVPVSGDPPGAPWPVDRSGHAHGGCPSCRVVVVAAP